jgi:predicted DCC family thiol-disulfide oxidoreductase YuxK
MMPKSKWRFKILVDGECPLCRREAQVLRLLDRGRGRLAIVDISAPGFDSSKYGRTMGELMGQIHGVTPRGRVVVGMEVFRQAYDAVGLGLLLWPTRWPILRQLSDTAYRWFSRNRLWLTGRATRCDSGRCRIGSAGWKS